MPEEKTDRGITRRTVLKLGVFGGGAAVGAGIIQNEREKENGIVTRNATFVPFYELHDRGVDSKSLPSDLKVYFREFSSPDLFTDTPQELLNSRAFSPFVRGGIKVISDDILLKLSQTQTEIMLGDIFLGARSLVEIPIQVVEFMGGIGAVVFGIKKDKKPLTTRRKFLKKAAIVGGAWAALPAMSSQASTLAGELQEGAIRRIAIRFNGIVSDFHPEVMTLFFRNAVVADKLLTIAGELKLDSPDKFAYHVGVGHGGIEDFLEAGRDFCRNLILAYPKDWLSEIVELNGGPKNFSSARLLRLPEDLTREDLKTGNKLNDSSDRIVVDTELQKGLEQKIR